MTTPGQPLLLAAKFHRPTARRSVPRPALTARLNTGLEAGRSLTLIAAPAGYGKTTLAAEWAGQLECPVAWLSLDEADDAPLRFCTYFLAALQQAEPAIGVELLPALHGGQLPPQAVLEAVLLNDLAATRPAGLRPLVCVLDDFHTIQDPAILAFLQGLLAHPSTGLHLAVVTREDPALPLARLRARDRLTEVRAADLRFNPAEIAAFLCDGMGLALSAADLARLGERTEGWITGLQLAGLSMQGRGDPSAFVADLSGSHRFILSYLAEEVLARQPAEVQEFLLHTSILAQLSGDLCDALTGRADSALLLERLLGANLFLVPLDDAGRWYRYHHLFAELLQEQLRRSGPQRAVELHRRASRWHEAQNMPVEAIRHALAAGEHDRVVQLLERHNWGLLNAGYARTLEGWLEALPDGLAGRSPRISLDFAWMHLLRGNFGQVGPRLAQAEAALTGSGDALGPAPAAALQAECLALKANLLQVQGRAAEAVTAARGSLSLAAAGDSRVMGLAALALGGAYRQLPDFERAAAALGDAIQASRASGDLVTEMLAVAHLTLMAIQYGRLRLAAGTATEAIERLERSAAAPPPIVGAVHGALGLVYLEWNQVEQARGHLQRGIRLATLSGHNASAIYSQCHLARLLQAEGDLAAAGRALDDAAALLAQGAPGWVQPELIGRQVSLALARGDTAGAQAQLRSSGVSADAPIAHQTDAIHLAWLRLLTACGDEMAAGLAQRIIRSAQAGGRAGTLLPALILAARLAADDDPVASRAHLAQALELAEPEGAIRVFLDEGEPLTALLERFGPPRWLAQHLPVSPAGGAAATSPASDRGGGRSAELPAESLSEREMEVLRLLAEGLTYAEAAERLVVSVNTVRFHVKELYGKLGVNRQAQAVARARELKLL